MRCVSKPGDISPTSPYLNRWEFGKISFRIFSLLSEPDGPLYREEREIEEVCLCTIQQVRANLNRLFLSNVVMIQEIPKGAHSVASGPPPSAFGSFGGGSYGKGLWFYAIDRARLGSVMDRNLLQMIRNCNRRIRGELFDVSTTRIHESYEVGPRPFHVNRKTKAMEVLWDRFLALQSLYLLMREVPLSME